MIENFAIIFDMDGVIVDSNPYHKISLKQFAGKYGHDLSEQQLREKIYGRTNGEWLKNLFGPLPPEQLHRLAEEKEQIFRELYQAEIKPINGLIPFLESIEQHHIPKAIATSAPPSNVDFTLNRTGLRHFFKTILDDTFISHSKPHPEIYLKAAAALQMPPERCIVIEDSLSGIKAGKDAGCKVVGITTTHTPEELTDADFVIIDFSGWDPVALAEKVF